MPKIVPKSIQTCFRVIFSKKIYAQCSMEGRVFRKFSIFFFKIPKMPKIVPKTIQTCCERVMGQIFRKIFLPSVPWRVDFSKIFKKNIFKIPKNAQKCSQSIQTCFRVIFSEKFYAQCSMEGRVFRKCSIFFFKIPKMPKIVPKTIQTCFERVMGQIFRKILCPVFHGGSSLRKFS